LPCHEKRTKKPRGRKAAIENHCYKRIELWHNGREGTKKKKKLTKGGGGKVPMGVTGGGRDRLLRHDLINS